MAEQRIVTPITELTRRRRWVSADAFIASYDDRRTLPSLPPRAREVHPATDEECYALNPPEECFGAARDSGFPAPAGRRRRTP